ncbi:MAG TPA: peptide deformylase [Gemmataceae bacterium]|nr:peptide deformylase [Gemmataceae bacterium]
MKIVHYPHPALRFPARPLTAIDKEVRLVAGRMLELMHEARGLGLAGNQVAWPHQLFVMNVRPDAESPGVEHVLINPVVLERKGAIEEEEGCLSFPKLYARVRRAKSVKVQAYNLEGQPVEIVTAALPPEISELASRVLQHEIDHLHGILFIDKLGPIGQLAVRGPLKEFEREHRKAQERGELPSDEEIEKRLKNGDGPLML